MGVPTEVSMADEDVFVPLRTLQAVLRSWWFVFLLVIAGGAAGWLFSRPHPPIYEAIGRFSANIDYVATGPLSQFEEDTALNGVGDVIQSQDVIQKVVDRAAAEGIRTSVARLKGVSVVERRFNIWELRVRSSDPGVAQRLANLWVEEGQAALRESYQHALQAQHLNRYLLSLESCLADTAASEPASAQCSPAQSAQIQAAILTTGKALAQERKASRGLFSGVLIGPVEQAARPEKPAIYNRNQVVLAGSLIGFVLGVALAQFGIPDRWLSRRHRDRQVRRCPVAKKLYLSSLWVAAGLMMFLLPFTSFPLVARLTGSQMVAPLAFLPMLFLLVFWLAPTLLRSGKLPAQVLPLLAFGVVAVVSAAAAFFLPFPAYKGSTLPRSEFRALATLLVGMFFYLVITGWSSQAGRIRFLLRWMNWGGVLLIGWSLFQAAVFFGAHNYPDWMYTFQGSVDSSLLLYGPRSNGFAYEPSWLSHQLNMLYLPIWTACVVTGFTAHRFHLGKIHFEHLLLLGGLACLGLSVSRIGWLTFLAMVAFLILLWNARLVSWVQDRVFRRRPETGLKASLLKAGFVLGSVLALGLVYAGLLYGAGFTLSRVDPRMAKLFDFTALREESFFHWANQNVFAERIVFWQAGWEVFNDYPILGVGLGNAGYFFPQKLSAFSLALTEVRTLMYQWTMLPNIKSLWVRLLAETGIAGFGLFLCWGYVLWQSAAFLRAWKDPFFRMIGLAGSLVLVGFIVEGFSLDTFALPYYWFSFGLLTAACEIGRQCAKGSVGRTVDGS